MKKRTVRQVRYLQRRNPTSRATNMSSGTVPNSKGWPRAQKCMEKAGVLDLGL